MFRFTMKTFAAVAAVALVQQQPQGADALQLKVAVTHHWVNGRKVPMDYFADDAVFDVDPDVNRLPNGVDIGRLDTPEAVEKFNAIWAEYETCHARGMEWDQYSRLKAAVPAAEWAEFLDLGKSWEEYMAHKNGLVKDTREIPVDFGTVGLKKSKAFKADMDAMSPFDEEDDSLPLSTVGAGLASIPQSDSEGSLPSLGTDGTALSNAETVEHSPAGSPKPIRRSPQLTKDLDMLPQKEAAEAHALRRQAFLSRPRI